MALLTNVPALLVLACVSHQLMLSSSQRSHGRTGGTVDRIQRKGKPGQAAQPMNGKWFAKDKSECTWAATGDDLFVIGVSCKKGDKSFGCEYVGRPTVCPQYASNVKLFWRQLARALKRKSNLCQEEASASVRVGMCRGADREAHFRLHNALEERSPRSTPPPAPRIIKSCQPNNRKLAEQYCHDSWSSVCTFFFTMLQDYDC